MFLGRIESWSAPEKSDEHIILGIEALSPNFLKVATIKN